MLEPGRRRKAFDIDLLTKMRLASCTIPEIAAEMNVDESTIDARLREDVLFRTMYERAPERGKAAVRMKMFTKAAVEGDLGALIWWSKNKLGWRDSPIEVSGPGGQPIVDVAAFRTMVEAAMAAGSSTLNINGPVAVALPAAAPKPAPANGKPVLEIEAVKAPVNGKAKE